MLKLLLKYRYFLIKVLQVITHFENNNLYTFLTTNKTNFKVALLKIEHCAAIRHPGWVEENKMISLIDKRQQNMFNKPYKVSFIWEGFCKLVIYHVNIYIYLLFDT